MKIIYKKQKAKSVCFVLFQQIDVVFVLLVSLLKKRKSIKNNRFFAEFCTDFRKIM